MHTRRGLLAISALLLSTSVADAQTSPKKPAKPADPSATAAAPINADKDPTPPPPSQPDPPKIDTGLKETDPSTEATNPWANSGLVKKRNGQAVKAPESSDHSDSPHRRDPDAMTDHGPISIAAFGGYASENLRLGFGVRAGYTLPVGLYLGAQFTYQNGIGLGDARLTFFYPAAEIGFDLRVLPEVTVRPYAGIGLGFFHESVSDGTTVEQPPAYLTFYPGLQVDYQTPDLPVFVGADFRYVFATVPDGFTYGHSFGAFLVVGGRF